MNTAWPVLYFSKAVLWLLILGALLMTAFALIVLIAMLLRDSRRKELW